MYGFTLSFLHTKKERYLDTAEKVADYFISCIPESGLIPVDFRQPSDCSWEDDIAASVAACGLIELSKVAKEWKKKTYLDAAVRMLKALDEKSCSYDIQTICWSAALQLTVMRNITSRLYTVITII